MAFQGVSGTVSSITVGVTPLAVEEADFNGECDVDDVTHTQANGFQVLVATISRATVTFSGGYDVNAKYHANPPNVVPGQSVAVTVTPDGSKNYTQTTMIVTKFHWRGGPKAGAVRFDGEARSTGSFSYPTN